MKIQLDDIVTQIPLFKKKIKEITDNHDFDEEDLIIEMLRFLNLIHLTNKKLSPSLIVDLAWHEFILFTKYYNVFCLKYFNRFIHHTPSESSDHAIYEKTIELYIQQYGKPSELIWGVHAINIWAASNCGSCHN
ncbi:hypothetical protein SAMN04489761_3866 [Tenacibaculum sp. MAR_2009_124]|uniref:glycine-rich domain-containing protein n=1 Tax=Tenacibaculum sp. MAR_2009_124 TaxID=1250059 RepID=UPI00089AC9FB|nr:hypothetical protein [Tenacibaculum sp. MAR_2009_124]SEC88523.1 hypothetical protein SAMN04489761_3866 [Tenacibaculum sp. MAR_2009_124]